MIIRLITITTPKIVRVSDYHELAEIRDTINKLNPSTKVKVSEIGFDGQYVGVLYVGRLKDHEDFIAVAKKKCKAAGY